MITLEQVPAVLGHPVYDISHSKVGTADHVYLDRYTGEPAWLTVPTGMFGSKETFVPMESVELSGDEVLVPYSKDQIKNAPQVQIDPDEELRTEDELLVYDYYNFPPESYQLTWPAPGDPRLAARSRRCATRACSSSAAA